ncbi:hypothetical protein [Rhizobium pisi]
MCLAYTDLAHGSDRDYYFRFSSRQECLDKAEQARFHASRAGDQAWKIVMAAPSSGPFVPAQAKALYAESRRLYDIASEVSQKCNNVFNQADLEYAKIKRNATRTLYEAARQLAPEELRLLEDKVREIDKAYQKVSSLKQAYFLASNWDRTTDAGKAAALRDAGINAAKVSGANGISTELLKSAIEASANTTLAAMQVLDAELERFSINDDDDSSSKTRTGHVSEPVAPVATGNESLGSEGQPKQKAINKKPVETKKLGECPGGAFWVLRPGATPDYRTDCHCPPGRSMDRRFDYHGPEGPRSHHCV